MCDLNELLVTNEGDVFPSPFDFDCASVNDLMHWLKSNCELMEFGLKYSRENVLAYDLMTKFVRLFNGHFELPLLWKNDAKLMPDSFVTAKKRLIGIKRRLQRDHVLKQKYCEQMNIALANDYAEVVLDEQIDESHRAWYISHDPVLNPHKPDKVRVVYDFAARSNHTSLNDSLMTGPDLVNKLFKVLFKVSERKESHCFRNLKQYFKFVPLFLILKLYSNKLELHLKIKIHFVSYGGQTETLI